MFIFLPIGRVMDDVIGYILKGFIITDDDVVKTRLPFKFTSQPVDVVGNGRFVGTDNGGNRIWFRGNTGHLVVVLVVG